MKENYEHEKRIKKLESIDKKTTKAIIEEAIKQKGVILFTDDLEFKEDMLFVVRKKISDSPTSNSPDGGRITDEKFLKQVCRSCPSFHECNWISPNCAAWEAYKKEHPK